MFWYWDHFSLNVLDPVYHLHRVTAEPSTVCSENYFTFQANLEEELKACARLVSNKGNQCKQNTVMSRRHVKRNKDLVGPLF